MADKELTVSVPGDRVSEFYEIFGRWLSMPGSVLVPKETLAPPKGQPWDAANDLSLANELVGKSAPAPRRELVLCLADQPLAPVSWRTIAARAGLADAASVAHLFTDIVAWCQSKNRQSPCVVLGADDSTTYYMDAGTAALFQKARHDPDPPKPAGPNQSA